MLKASSRPQNPIEAAEFLSRGAFHFRQLEGWLQSAHRLGARGDEFYKPILPQVQNLLTSMQEFEEGATRLACLLSHENPDKDDARCGFVFLGGVAADKEREQWMRRVGRRYVD